MPEQPKLLFGGSSGWLSRDWTASDDRLRGGRSQSYWSCSPRETNAKFYGNLDIDTLGGAGFASQRTASDDLSFNLSQFDGVQLIIAAADLKCYTLVLKDTLLPRSDNGREQAGLSWEYDFHVALEPTCPEQLLIQIPWSDFKPCYRGKEIGGAKPLDTSGIKRISFMMRSFFGSQQGPFELVLESISAYKDNGKTTPDMGLASEESSNLEKRMDMSKFPYPYRDYLQYEPSPVVNEKQSGGKPGNANRSDGGWLCGLCGN